MSQSLYARDVATGAYKELAAIEVDPGVWGLAVDVGAATPAAGNPNSAVTSVAASITSVSLLTANAARKGFAIYNDSTANLFLKLGATASSSSFTVKMVAASYFEVPFSYVGAVDGIWDAATGNARITEIT